MLAAAFLIRGKDPIATRLEILANVGAGLGCILYGLLLLTRDSRPLLHARLGRFVFVLGVAIFARGVVWGGGSKLLSHLMQGAFGLFPLLLALFFESLLRRHLHLVSKLVLLFATLFFVGTSWTDMAVKAQWWSLALITYHSLTVAYLGALTFVELRKAPQGPRRSMYGATLLVCAIALVLMATDWTHPLDLSTPKLGAIPALAVIYFGGSMLDAADEWQLRTSVLRLILYVLCSLVLAWMISLALGHDRAVPFFLTAGTLLFALISFEPFRLELARHRAQSANLLVDRLSHLNARTMDELIQSLRGWPEVEKVVLLRAQDLPVEKAKVSSYLQSAGSVATLSEVNRALALTSSNERLFVLDQVRHVMRTWNVQYLGLVSQSGDFLGVTFHVGLDPATYRRAFELIVFVARLLSPKEGK